MKIYYIFPKYNIIMIETPYKLDLILTTSYKDSTNAKQIQQKKSSYANSENKQYFNKLKQMVLNMTKSDNYYLIADKKSGFANFNIELTNNDRLNEKNYSEYVLSNGLAGPIYLDSDSELKRYINFDSDCIVLKLIEHPIESIEKFISKWHSDNNIYEKNIPQIYFYGQITNEQGDFLSYYYVTKKYHNYLEIIKKDNFNFSVNFLKQLLILLNDLLSRNYIFRNLNMFGLGYDIVRDSEQNEQVNLIILEYTDITLLSLDDEFFNELKKVRCIGTKCVGNLTPYYVIDDYYNMEDNWLKRLTKSYSLGLVEIILLMFFNNDDNLTKIYDFIVGPSIFEPQLHYYHFYKRFNSDINIHNLILMINSLNMKYCNINPIFENMLETLLINLLDKEYEKINFPNYILNMIVEAEKANLEFDINYTPKNSIYNPKNDTFLNTSLDTKQKILSEDNLEYDKNNDNSKYYNLYKKYKYKYTTLKNISNYNNKKN